MANVEWSRDLSTLSWIRTTITAAQAIALKRTVGFVLAAGRTGWMYVPVFLEVMKPASAAFTVAAPADIAVGYEGVGGILAVSSVGLLDQTAATRLFSTITTFGPRGADPIADDPDTYSGKALSVLISSYEGTHTGRFEEFNGRYTGVAGLDEPGLFAYSGGEWERVGGAGGSEAGFVADHTEQWEREYTNFGSLAAGAPLSIVVGFLQVQVASV